MPRLNEEIIEFVFNPETAWDLENYVYIPIKEEDLDIKWTARGLEKYVFDTMPDVFVAERRAASMALEHVEVIGRTILMVVGPDEGCLYVEVPRVANEQA